jgi:diadenosine tetraphosphatase ApaH/serine/threonine PP2A family protein phosphatase
MLALLALLLVTQQDDEAALRARVAAQPESVQDFIGRRAGCNHWGGEPDEMRERRLQIQRAMRELRCDTIDGEGIFLRRYFASRPDTIALLDETRDLSGW